MFEPLYATPIELTHKEYELIDNINKITNDKNVTAAFLYAFSLWMDKTYQKPDETLTYEVQHGERMEH